MNVESLMWVSVKRFHQLTSLPIEAIYAACKSGALVSKRSRGWSKMEYRICVTNLTVPILERHFATEISKDEQRSTYHIKDLEVLNSDKYKSMMPFQQKNIKKWLSILSESCGMPMDELLEYLKEKNVTYSTFRRYKSKWIKSDGDIDSLKTHYHQCLGISSKNPT